MDTVTSSQHEEPLFDARGLVELNARVPHVSEIDGDSASFDARELTTRQINLELRSLLYEQGIKQVTVRNLRIRAIDIEENLILVEGAVPGPRDGYVLISKCKAPPRERRGFAGAATKDALKASKKASGKKK